MATQTWNIDVGHSGIHFTVRHMMFAKVRGTFTQWEGSFTLDDADPSKSSVSVTIDAASIDTSEPKRDEHLRSPDFFDVAKYPKITFVSRKVERDGDRLKITGDLTVHGVTREVVLDAEQTGSGKDPWGNQRVGFSARTSVLRSDFGLTWNQALETGGVLVGDKIEIEVEVSAVLAKAQQVA